MRKKQHARVQETVTKSALHGRASSSNDPIVCAGDPPLAASVGDELPPTDMAAFHVVENHVSDIDAVHNLNLN